MTKVSVKIPATSANLGPGFDTLGMALSFYDNYSAEVIDSGLEISVVGEGEKDIPRDQTNLIYSTIAFVFAKFHKTVPPLRINCHNNIPHGRGMGSSGAAVSGGVMLAAGLLKPEIVLTEQQLLDFATELEGHPDNVTPALLGNIHCCDEYENNALAWPEDWGLVYVVPNTPVSTQAARKVLPPQYTQAELTHTQQQLSRWLEAINTQDPVLFSQAITGDVIHEPYRSQLIPEYTELKSFITQQQVNDKNLLGLVISGSGSTMLCPTTSINSAQALKQQLQQHPAFSNCKIMVLSPNTTGAKVS
jgi:homoserine kinase